MRSDPVQRGALFVKAIEAIYDAAPDPSRWSQSLQAIADCFEDVGANLLWRRDDGSIGNIVSPKLRTALADYERGEWWRQDIRVARAIEHAYRTNQGALTDRHVATDEETKSHPIYSQFLASHGLRWVAGVEVSPTAHITVTINVQRSRDKPPFSEAELGILTELGVHAEKSLRLSIRLLDAELSNLGFGDALARLGIGVFALDSLKRVVFANPAGKRLMGDGLELARDRLLVRPSAERAALNATIDQMILGAPSDLARSPKPILIHRQSSDRPLALYVLPIVAAGNRTDHFLTHTRVIVLVMDSRKDAPADPALVRDVLGLTLGEARVASLVGGGLAPRDAAEKLGITEETARTALKRVFAKIGVSRQSELTALLTKLILR